MPRRIFENKEARDNKFLPIFIYYLECTKQAKFVEVFWEQCLDEGSSPSISTTSL